MEYINKSKVDSIMFDNDYSFDDVKNDFDNNPESWGCVLNGEKSFDELTKKEKKEFRAELFKYTK